MLEQNENDKIIGIFLYIFSFCLLIAGFIRLFFGIELTDEAYYISSSYRYLQGSIPFVNAWDITNGSALLTVPALFLIRLANDGTESMFLYSRIAFYILKIILGIWVHLALRKRLGNAFSCLLWIVFVVYAPFSLNNFSYNNLCLLLCFSGVFAIFYAIDQQSKPKWRFAMCFAGTSHALMAFSYLTSVSICIATPLLIIFIFAMKGEQLKSAVFRLIPYIVGGFVSAFVLFTYIMFVTEMNLPAYIRYMYTYWFAFFTIKVSLLSSIVSMTVSTLIVLNPIHVVAALSIPFSAYLSSRIRITTQLTQKLLSVYTTVAILAFMVIPLRDLLFVNNSHGVARYAFLIGIFQPFIIIYPFRPRSFKYMVMYLTFIPSLLLYLAFSMTSSGGAVNAQCTFFLSAIGSVVQIMILMSEAYNNHNQTADKLKRIASDICAVAAPVLFSICLLSLFYTDIYRSPPIPELTTRVQTGVFKGLYTTQELAINIQKTEHYVKSFQNQGNTVLHLGKAPHMYLFSDITPAAPNVWYTSILVDGPQSKLYYSLDKSNVPDLIFLTTKSEVDAFKSEDDFFFKDMLNTYYEQINTVSSEAVLEDADNDYFIFCDVYRLKPDYNYNELIRNGLDSSFWEDTAKHFKKIIVLPVSMDMKSFEQLAFFAMKNNLELYATNIYLDENSYTKDRVQPLQKIEENSINNIKLGNPEKDTLYIINDRQLLSQLSGSIDFYDGYNVLYAK